MIPCEHSFKRCFRAKVSSQTSILFDSIDSTSNFAKKLNAAENVIASLDDHELHLFYSGSRIILWGWMPKMDLASCCCTWSMLGVIAGVIVLSLIPLYLPERYVDKYNLGSMPYSHQLIFLFTQNSSLFRHGRHSCVLRHIFEEYKFINSHEFYCNS
jgi:hypothetical protein